MRQWAQRAAHGPCRHVVRAWLWTTTPVASPPPPALPHKAPIHRRPSSASHTGQNPSPATTTAANPQTFVSSHYRMDASTIRDYLTRKKLVFTERNDTIIVKDCPFCHPINNRRDNQFKLHVWVSNGGHFCHRCGSKGSWFDLKRHLGDLTKDRVQPMLDAWSATPPTAPKEPNQAAVVAYEQALTDPKHQAVLDMLTGTDVGQRGLTLHTLQRYAVGIAMAQFPADDGSWHEHVCVSFPWTRVRDPVPVSEDKEEGEEKDPQDPFARADAAVVPDHHVDRVKLRSTKQKRFQRLVPTGGGWGFFGWHTVPPRATSIILCEGEYDAMAVFQSTGLPAISLPNGARSLPVELLPRLEPFTRIVLWMDDDKAGHEGAEDFCKKLGAKRCLLVQPRKVLGTSGPKDANEALLQGHDLMNLIHAAEPLSHEQITTFAQLRHQVQQELTEPLVAQGIQCSSLPSLNRILKGHRRGELTILTGFTGVGKTTVLSQLSLDLCEAGVSTLWGSFEIKNVKLAKTMLCQHARLNLANHIDTFDAWADSFAQLPLYFMRFFGSSNVEQVVDAMEYAVYVYDVQHIVLDNLQFMMSGQGRGYDRFERQDHAVDVFRKFSSHHNVHITIVIHPRKEDDSAMLGLSSVFGTAKATQEADNVMMIQRMPGTSPDEQLRALEVKKNRFDGEVGVVPFVFDRQSLRIVEMDAAEVSKMGQRSRSFADTSSGARAKERESMAHVQRQQNIKMQEEREELAAAAVADRVEEAPVVPRPPTAPPATKEDTPKMQKLSPDRVFEMDDEFGEALDEWLAPEPLN